MEVTGVTELLVIGGGMAGAMAALSARRWDADVVLARRSFGATALSSGAVDVAADPRAPSGDLRSQLVAPEQAARELARSLPDHPYAILARQLPRLRETLRFAAEQLSSVLAPPGERNALLPTPLGTVKPAAMAQISQTGADLASLPPLVAVVQLRMSIGDDARIIAQGLESAAAALGRSLRAVVVESGYFAMVDDALRSPYERAELLERPGAIDEFAKELRVRLPPGIGAILLPPIFGMHDPSLVSKLAGLLGVPCAEVLSAAPSVPGIRLQQAIDAALARGGVRVIETEVHRAASAADAFALGTGGLIEPRSTVLATGRFIGGGVVRASRFQESVLDLPVFAGAKRLEDQHIGDLLDPKLLGEHTAIRAGVKIDDSLRPLGADGEPFHPRLFAAGSVIGGYDPALDKTGLGVAIFTGYLAGEAAAATTS
jgi:glycerol-3-phosphate dehydrogenase subunit B